MTEEDIQEILETLGSRVGILSEENRLCKVRDDAGKELISQLADIISPSDWVNLYESTDNTFVKDLMKEWGPHFFPEDYELQ